MIPVKADFHLRIALIVLLSSLLIFASCAVKENIPLDITPLRASYYWGELVEIPIPEIADTIEGSWYWTVNGKTLSNAGLSSYVLNSDSLHFIVTPDADTSYTICLQGESRRNQYFAETTVSVQNFSGYSPLGFRGSFDLELPLSASGDVYFILHNTGTSTVSSSVEVSASELSDNTYPASLTWIHKENYQEPENNTILPPREEISNFRDIMPALQIGPRSRSSYSTIPEPSLNTVGITQETFYTDPIYNAGYLTDRDTATSTLRYKATVTTPHGDKTLQIWVADVWYNYAIDDTNDNPDFDAIPDAYDASISSSLINILAEAFLKPGANNDIYDWVAGSLGEEWGPHPYNNLIGENDIIDIIIFDIDGDVAVDEGKVLGYFWGLDTFAPAAESLSNGRVMFYMDGPFLHYTDSFWASAKEVLISTLAHEFQHMINWYQRPIIRDTADGVWMNEMMSMMVEDLVAENLTSETGMTILPPTDRLGSFLYYPEDQLTAWPGLFNVASDYAISYAFGAYLLRNFGGVTMLHSLMEASTSDIEAVGEALQARGYGLEFADAMKRWTGAVLLSDGSYQEPPLSHTGGTSYSDSSSFTIPSINLSGIEQIDNDPAMNMYGVNYMDASGNPNFIIDLSGDTRIAGLPPSSNLYIKIRDNVSGSQSFTISLPQGVSMSVVVK